MNKKLICSKCGKESTCKCYEKLDVVYECLCGRLYYEEKSAEKCCEVKK